MAIPLSFIWKGQNSLQDYGLMIKSFPDRIRPAERYKIDGHEITGVMDRHLGELLTARRFA